MIFTIYNSDFIGKQDNVLYPHEVKINDLNDLKSAVAKDYVCAKYKDNKRSKDNFICSDCIALDFDNESNNPEEWITKDDLIAAFPGVTIAFHYSRHHMKPKKDKSARPRFHCFMPISPIYDANEYAKLKSKINAMFPYCDKGALDAARFFYGTDDPEVEIVKGDMTLTDFLEEEEFDRELDKIKEGSRNSTMSRFAAKVLKRYGDTDEAYEAFNEKASLCVPPLENEELDTIWKSALRFFKKISSMPGYVLPEKYNDKNSYKPVDYTDVGQASVLAKYFKDVLRYSAATHFLCFRGKYWEESEIGAQAVVHELTRRQLVEAHNEIIKTSKLLKDNGAKNIIDVNGKKKSMDLLNKEQLEIYLRFLSAQDYQRFVLGRRESKYISACLKEVKPMVEITPSELDSDPFLLCTPNATYDLRIGLSSARPNSSLDFMTKCTAVSPGDKGKEIWLDAINTIFAKNPELIDYVQLVCGLAVIGKVMVEGMIIAYGDGGNGKSTFWNAIFRTLGLYSGKISADTLTTQCRRNTRPELAEAKGKRLLIASESQQGARLDESIVKQLCSTDEVEAEKKYKDPFHYVPCHTLVLYTNYLPRVSGLDDGIWNRLFVIPFNNKLRGGKGDIKNYADFLFENAGEYILKWVIEGAKKVIDLNYCLPIPPVVKNAIDEYREMNNWFNHFIDDCCEIDPNAKESSSALYSAYRKYSQENGEFVRSTTEFYSTIEKSGYKRLVIKRLKYIKGLKLVDKYNDASIDFLT